MIIDTTFDFTSDTPGYWDGFWERGGGLGAGGKDPDSHSPTLKACVYCGASLRGAVLTLPWEDGDNEYACVTCPSCGEENTQYGFGEDD